MNVYMHERHIDQLSLSPKRGDHNAKQDWKTGEQGENKGQLVKKKHKGTQSKIWKCLTQRIYWGWHMLYT